MGAAAAVGLANLAYWSRTRRTTHSFPPSTRTRSCGAGTCGATSTPATAPRRYGSRWATTHPGADVFIIANADTVMSRSNEELMAEVFPNVPMTRPVGPHETLLSIDKARRVLGYDPQHSWRHL